MKQRDIAHELLHDFWRSHLPFHTIEKAIVGWYASGWVHPKATAACRLETYAIRCSNPLARPSIAVLATKAPKIGASSERP